MAIIPHNYQEKETEPIVDRYEDTVMTMIKHCRKYRTTFTIFLQMFV